MKPFFEDPALTLYQGDALAVLQSLPPLCVDAVITESTRKKTVFAD